mgnify:CR=1 FL=1
MRNRIMILLILSIFTLTIFSSICFADPIRFSISANCTPEHPFSRSMKWVERTLERRTNGEIDVEYYFLGQLGSAKEQMELLMSGDLDYVMLGPREVGRYIPEVGILNGPYIFRDFDHAFKVMESSIGKELNEKCIDQLGIRIIVGVYEFGVRHLTTSKKIIKSPEDLHGEKMRVMDEPVSIAVMRAMGAKAVPIAFGELYLALKQGIADGQENPISNIIACKFQEVQKYLMLTGHVWNIGCGFINEAKYQSLTPENREIVVNTLQEGSAISDFLTEQAEIEGFKIWEEAGNEIIKVDVEAFKKPVVESIYYDLKKDEWKDLFEEIQAIE